ncbi:hypothetical protein CSHISOI_00819, partial [Colletotrichum shisoi]
ASASSQLPSSALSIAAPSDWKAAAKATQSTPGSSSRVKKNTGRVGRKGTKAMKSEEKVEDSEPEDSKLETTGELTGFKLEEEI